MDAPRSTEHVHVSATADSLAIAWTDGRLVALTGLAIGVAIAVAALLLANGRYTPTTWVAMTAGSLVGIAGVGLQRHCRVVVDRKHVVAAAGRRHRCGLAIGDVVELAVHRAAGRWQVLAERRSGAVVVVVFSPDEAIARHVAGTIAERLAVNVRLSV